MGKVYLKHDIKINRICQDISKYVRIKNLKQRKNSLNVFHLYKLIKYEIRNLNTGRL